MNVEELFLRLLQDLHNSIYSNDEYELLKASGIIRQLYFDGRNSVVQQSNKLYQLKLLYLVSKEKNIFQMSIISDSIFLNNIEPNGNKELDDFRLINQTTFFKLIVGSVSDEIITVKDLIKYLANEVGGVHKEENSKIQNLYKIKKGKIPIPLVQLRSIGSVILNTLREIKYKILNLEQYDKKPGLSVHFLIALRKTHKGKENYLLDFGNEPTKNRISIYVNNYDQLVFSVYDDDCKLHEIKSCVIDYNIIGYPSYLMFQIVSIENKGYLMIEFGGWNYISETNININFSDMKYYYVLGSDIYGNKNSHYYIYKLLILNKIPTFQKTKNMYFSMFSEITNNSSCVYLGHNKFMYTKNHPLHTKSSK